MENNFTSTYDLTEVTVEEARGRIILSLDRPLRFCSTDLTVMEARKLRLFLTRTIRKAESTIAGEVWKTG